MHLFVLRFVENIGEATFATVLPVKVGCHEHASSALLSRAFPSQAVDLSVVVHLVVLKHCQLHLSVLVLNLLWGCVVLLLPLLGATPEPEHKVKGALFLDVIVALSPTITSRKRAPFTLCSGSGVAPRRGRRRTTQPQRRLSTSTER